MPTCVGLAATAPPYSQSNNDGANAYDAPVPGLIADDTDPGGFIPHPVYFGWGAEVVADSYRRADADLTFGDPSLALGPVSADNFDVVSLGESSAARLAAGGAPGSITIKFARPVADAQGADFVVFENGHIALWDLGGAGVGGVFGELAFIEVSSNGTDFARFAGQSRTLNAVGPYASLDSRLIFNLAGKHALVVADEEQWGTPFDLAGLATAPEVLAGKVDLSNILYVRVVDIPGNGAFKDASGRPIYDPYPTYGSGGFDLDGIGAISVPVTFAEWQDINALQAAQKGATADPDGDGVTNVLECAQGLQPLQDDAALGATSDAGEPGVVSLSFTRDTRIKDLVVNVQCSDDNGQTWQTIARSENGAELQAVAPFTPLITDGAASPKQSTGTRQASPILSVGVVRAHTVTLSYAGASAPQLRLSAGLSGVATWHAPIQRISYAGWQAMHGLEGIGALAGEDPDGDGLSNLLEYAIGRHPQRKDGSAPTSVLVAAGQAGILITRDLRATEVDFTVDTSLSLNQWQTMAASTAGGNLLPQAGDAGLPFVQSQAGVGPVQRLWIGSPALTNRFFRLKLEQLP